MVTLNRHRQTPRRLAFVASFTAVLLLLLTGGKERSSMADSGTLPVVFAASLGEDACTSPGADELLAQGESSALGGGDLSPLRYVVDPYPTFNGIALDLKTNPVVLSDENRKRVL